MLPNPDDDLKMGRLLVQKEGNASPLPLLDTAITGAITGSVASVTVTQTFSNPFKDMIELSYLFPLPHEAAIVDYEIQIASRTIRAEIKEIETARKVYQEAVEAGHATSLLEQRRPNLFAVQIGNVQPGVRIITTIRYQERLHYADDGYTFVFPMGVTPKYHADLSQAALVDSPVAAKDEPISPVTLTLSVDAGVAVGAPSSPSHEIHTMREDERRFTVTLPPNTIPNKDFVLRYSIANNAVQPVLWMSADNNAETLLLTLVPPRLTDDLTPDPREFIFVIDRSGSMNGAPLEQAKNALRACLRAMTPNDTFTIQAFDDRVEWFAPKAQPVTQDAVNRADQWLNSIDSRGGTEIVGAITAALALPADTQHQRYIVFLTDGAVSAEEAAQNTVKKMRGTARIFTFGIGSSVNRALLAKMAEFGRGTAEFLQVNEDIETAITRFQDRVSYPALQDLALNWQNAETWDSYPATLPDLYIGQAIELTVRLKRKYSNTEAALTVTGKRHGQTVTLNTPIPVVSTTDPALQRVWARARVDALLEQPATDTIRQQIISLALDNRLVTPYTAFVAVDSETIQTTGDAPRKVSVAVPLPEDVDFGVDNIRTLTTLKAASSMRVMHVGGRTLPAPSPQSAPSNDPFGGLDPIAWLESLAKRQASDAPSAAGLSDWLDAVPEEKGTPIESLDLSTGLLDSLQQTGITTAEEAREMLDRGSDAMLAIRNFDATALDELEHKLQEKGVLASPEPPKAEPAPLETFGSIPERIKWLARTQNLSGSWGNGADEGEQTAAALLAFVRAGHTTRAGNYRAQVRKAADWLKAATLTGFAAFARWRALRELDAAQNTDVYALAALEPGQPTSDPERAASGDTTLTVPTSVASLDEVRIISMLVGEAAPSGALHKDRSREALIQTWTAVGKSKH